MARKRPKVGSQPFLCEVNIAFRSYIVTPRRQKDVTLKIIKADASKTSKELSILLQLSKAETPPPGKDHIIELLDHFEHTGPNGLHLVLVFPAMLSDGEKLCERGKPRSAGYIRSISLRIITALEFLHRQGFVHTGKVSRANHSL
jgi:serine/threonine-protein kinase SRPK3